MNRNDETEDDISPAPEGGSVRVKLKLAAHYAMLAFAPVVSIAALGIALFAGSNHSDRAQFDELNSSIENLNAGLMATKSELDNLKFSMTREKSQHGDERKKSDELDARIIRDITHLQMKLKISPTLEEQLRTVASAHAAVSPVASAVSAPVVADKMQAAPAPLPTSAPKKPAAVTVPKETAEKPAAAASAPKANGKKKPVPPPAKKKVDTESPQVKAMRKAIEEYNKQ